MKVVVGIFAIFGAAVVVIGLGVAYALGTFER